MEEVKARIKRYIKFYNEERVHQSLECSTRWFYYKSFREEKLKPTVA
ncbi:MAG: hypothetical protein LBC22_04660 [Endomicrobium sp.]|jgi:hypothetical protein|nr:hypothetical protein [Endomicrobium sp.]